MISPRTPTAQRHIVVLSSLFPSRIQPNAGPFVRERMFRVAAHLPLAVVAPTPWFPLQSLLRLWKPHFRPGAPRFEQQQGIDVWFPRFLSVPGVLKRFDALFMALGAWPQLYQLKRAGRLDWLDAHFGYPDGVAASLLAGWLKVPYTITLRGSEKTYAETPAFRRQMARALQQANRVIGVSQSLCRLAISLGTAPDKVIVVPNGVDADTFYPVDRRQARQRLGLPENAPILISIGWLIERKGFHRVIEVLPALLDQYPDLHYLIVGGATGADSLEAALRQQVRSLNLEARVYFLGPVVQSEIKWVLSAADLFVLATRREGWANVFLEAMACGLPVVTTDVDGNPEVVARPEYGTVVPFGDALALRQAIAHALTNSWDRAAIIAFARTNAWDKRIDKLLKVFSQT
jgi:glycosyltransferase involved in cell wall biosynthesis